jgi:hypothetical protein
LSKSPLNKKTAKLAQQSIFFNNNKSTRLLKYKYQELTDTFHWAK